MSCIVLLERCSESTTPSEAVQATEAALELEESHDSWGYSKPVVAFDILLNMTFVVATAAILPCSGRERRNTPIRVWIVGYALLCFFHSVLVWLEYRRRQSDSGDETTSDGNNNSHGDQNSSSQPRFTKRCALINTGVSVVWWMAGIYFVIGGGDIFKQHDPRLYWLALVFLASDIIICAIVAFMLFIVLFICCPCITAVLYNKPVGASEENLSILPKYRFQIVSNEEKASSGGFGSIVPVKTTTGHVANERMLLREDAECCICIHPYEDGVELQILPCNHHFHFSCIVKWLKINATCPLCKYNILKGIEQV
ncbi:E3 ubiquitin protein ligase RIE1-like [Cicer arietinum]|uniref:RING-type E3 ubiquitin transferase n=1 Tax=Cicer arietinum TaxID=3827 RepID=A0A1S2Y2G3_CICAR|nr:E3 ubiquitin protein ligase RIE1-like [Cicer arietinum]